MLDMNAPERDWDGIRKSLAGFWSGNGISMMVSTLGAFVLSLEDSFDIQ